MLRQLVENFRPVDISNNSSINELDLESFTGKWFSIGELVRSSICDGALRWRGNTPYGVNGIWWS
jgi:hypothetical protein